MPAWRQKAQGFLHLFFDAAPILKISSNFWSSALKRHLLKRHLTLSELCFSTWPPKNPGSNRRLLEFSETHGAGDWERLNGGSQMGAWGTCPELSTTAYNSKPVVWETRGLHPGFPWFSSFPSFP